MTRCRFIADPQAKIECGEWESTEAPYQDRFPRLSEGGLHEAYTDPLDPRSGAMHLRHIGVHDDQAY